MNNSSAAIRFFYGTRPGRAMLSMALHGRADRLAVRFLWSGWSRPLIGWYARRHSIPLTPNEKRAFSSFRDFFARERRMARVDPNPGHLISPCDGWLSSFPIQADSSFRIKGANYQLSDLLGDEKLARRFHDGTCLIFRLEASDYHHYCYIDDGYQGSNHRIPGMLHSVQPSACVAYPVYTLNRRMWTLLATENFGPVVQTEIGAFVVGGIVALRDRGRFRKGSPMGRFELAGSTIVLLFEKDRIRLLPALSGDSAAGTEVRVQQGQWIGNAVRRTGHA